MNNSTALDGPTAGQVGNASDQSQRMSASEPKLPLLHALSNPTVCVVICNYNHGRYIDAAIQSAVEQRYPTQVIVVDDGSTDDSRERIEAWSKDVTTVFQPNGGQVSAYNSGKLRVTSDVVVFLDADDRLLPHAAETIAQAFSAGVAKVHFRMRLIDEFGKPIGGHIPNVLARGKVMAPFLRYGLLYPSAPGSGNAYRRAVLDCLFPLPVSAVDSHGADFFAIYGSAVFGEVGACDEILGEYRVEQGVVARGYDLVFGNAARNVNEHNRFDRRVQAFRPWIEERTAGRVVLPKRFIDFSVQKGRFASAVVSGSYLTGWRLGFRELPVLVKSIWLRSDLSVTRKLGLTTWAGLVLVLPKRAKVPIARYICNPASRGNFSA